MPEPEKICALAIVDRSKKELLIIEKPLSRSGYEHERCIELWCELHADPHALELASVASKHLWHLAGLFAKGAAAGIGLAASRHLYKKAGEELVDKTWNWTKEKVFAKPSPRPTLYGPDGELITGKVESR